MWFCWSKTHSHEFVHYSMHACFSRKREGDKLKTHLFGWDIRDLSVCHFICDNTLREHAVSLKCAIELETSPIYTKSDARPMHTDESSTCSGLWHRLRLVGERTMPKKYTLPRLDDIFFTANDRKRCWKEPENLDNKQNRRKKVHLNLKGTRGKYGKVGTLFWSPLKCWLVWWTYGANWPLKIIV